MNIRVILLFLTLQLIPLSQCPALADSQLTTYMTETIEKYQQLDLLSNNYTSKNTLLSTAWHLRVPHDASGELQTFNIQSLQEAKPSVGDLREFTLSNIHFSHHRIAIARLDLVKETLTSLLVLFKEERSWKVVADLRTNNGCLRQVKKYGDRGQHERVLTVLGKYYDAVRFETAPMLEDVFHPDWYMKNHKGQLAVFEDATSFNKYLTGNKHTSYYDNREIADVQVIYDCMALVRIDSTQSGGHTFFAFYKQQDKWLITDKIWTVPLN